MEQHAVVIGSGMAGLATATVLSRHFAVTVLEKDPEPSSAGLSMSAAEVASLDAPLRPGVPQYTHLHALLGEGLRLYDSDGIFGGAFSAGLTAAGATAADNHTGLLLFHPRTGLEPWVRDDPHDKPVRQPIPLCLSTRHTFETTARRLVAANPRVDIRYSAPAAGLLFDGGASHDSGSAAAADGSGDGGGKGPRAVTGVLLADGTRLAADLVVDCSGRASPLPGWLAAAGFQRPRTSRAGCDCGYASWLCKLAPEVHAALVAAGVSAVNVLACAPERTMFLMLRVQDKENVYMAALGGNEGLHPSRRDDELLQFATEHVWHPVAGRLLVGSTPLCPASRKYGIASTRRHYEEADCEKNWPEGLLVMADSLCSFSPVYGQGASVGAIQAAALASLLRRRAAARDKAASARGSASASATGSSDGSGTPAWLCGLSREFFSAVLPTVNTAWQLAVSGDMRYPTASTNDASLLHKSLLQRFLDEYIQLVFIACGSDSVVKEAFVRVLNLTAGPELLMRPSIVARTLWRAWLLPRATAALPAWLSSALGAGQPGAEGCSSARPRHESPELLQLVGAASAARDCCVLRKCLQQGCSSPP